MLYEVITVGGEHAVLQTEKEAGGGLAGAGNADQDQIRRGVVLGDGAIVVARITSYNVCYTKLLRCNTLCQLGVGYTGCRFSNKTSGSSTI